MSRKRKKLFITLGLLAVVVGGFYYFYFVSTEAAVRHAEAFLFSRATVNRLGEQGSYRHFYVTNRVLESKHAPIDRRFSSERSPALAFSFTEDARGRILEMTLHQGGTVGPLPRLDIALEPEVPRAELERYLGSYRSVGGDDVFEIVVRRGDLALAIPGFKTYRMRPPDADGRWVSTYDGEALVGQPKFAPGERYLSSAVFSRPT